MGAEARCDNTDLLISQCAHCRGLADIETQALLDRAALIATGQWFPARYAGKCTQCGERFGEGAAIGGFTVETGGWVAECCGDTEDGA